MPSSVAEVSPVEAKATSPSRPIEQVPSQRETSDIGPGKKTIVDNVRQKVGEWWKGIRGKHPNPNQVAGEDTKAFLAKLEEASADGAASLAASRDVTQRGTASSSNGPLEGNSSIAIKNNEDAPEVQLINVGQRPKEPQIDEFREIELHNQVFDLLQNDEKTKKFLSKIERPSLYTKVWKKLHPEDDIDGLFHKQNMNLLIKLAGKDTLATVQSGGDFLTKLGEKIKGMTVADLQKIIGEASDDNVFVLKRLQRALGSSSATRDTAKVLRTLRKEGSYTLPGYIGKKENMEIIIGGVMHEGAKLIGHLASLVAKQAASAAA